MPQSQSALFLIAYIWILNFAISWWNAYAVGRVWIEAKFAGFFARFMCWMGAAMAACGFSWCFLIFLVVGAHHFHYITPRQLEVSLQLGYIILIPVILFSGAAITLESWVDAWRNRNLLSVGRAAWNTYAMAHNTYEAIEGFGPALESVIDFFRPSGSSKKRSSSSKEEKGDGGALVVVLLVAVSLIGGVLLTAAIIYRTAGSRPLPSWEEIAGRNRSGRPAKIPARDNSF